MKTSEMGIGKFFQCRYNGNRLVKGTIEAIIDEYTVHIRLSLDYVGKNDTWYAGEVKMINLKIAKKIHIIETP